MIKTQWAAKGKEKKKMVLSVHNGKTFWFRWAVLCGSFPPLIFNFKTNFSWRFHWGTWERYYK